jgi:hypothetical protein
MANSSDLVVKVSRDEIDDLPAPITVKMWADLRELMLNVIHRLTVLELQREGNENRSATFVKWFGDNEARFQATATTEHAIEIAIGAIDERLTHLERQVHPQEEGAAASLEELARKIVELEQTAVRYSKQASGSMHRHLIGRE